jgi:hypothetical protein
MSGWRHHSNEMGESQHYCRTCEQEFTTNDKASAHLQALGHYIHDHDNWRAYQRCTIGCELRAQPEEITAGHRMYGPGAPKGTPNTDYARLFPEED